MLTKLKRDLYLFVYQKYFFAKKYDLNKDDIKIVRSLFKYGYYIINNYWSPSKCDKVKEQLDNFVSCNDSDLDFENGAYLRINRNKGLKNDSGVSRIYHVDKMFEQLKCIREDKRINNIINAYYGYRMYSTYIAFQRNELSQNETRDFHVDGFSPEFKTFLYLENVDMDNGPFCYISTSNKAHKKREKRIKSNNPSTSFTEEEIGSLLMNRKKVLCAPKGALILADTLGFHRGLPQRKHTRSILFNNYFSKDTGFSPSK